MSIACSCVRLLLLLRQWCRALILDDWVCEGDGWLLTFMCISGLLAMAGLWFT